MVSCRFLFILSLCIRGFHGQINGCNRDEPVNNMECRIICRDITTGEPGKVAAKLIADNLGQWALQCAKWSVEIYNSQFTNNDLGPNWFDDPNPLPNIDRVILHTNGLTSISAGAFNGFMFGSNLKALAIYYNPGLVNINAGMNIGLSDLKTFSWIGNGILTSFDKDALSPFASSIEVLSINDCGFENANVFADVTQYCTATGALPSLKTLDFGYNYKTAAMKVLNQTHFDQMSVVLSVYLKGSDIQYLTNTVYDSMAPTLQQLDISDNLLTTLPEGIFDAIIANNKPQFTVALQGNNWHCDCNLQWLQNIFLNGIGNIALVDAPRCTTPDSEFNKLLVEANMTTVCDIPPTVPPVDAQCPPIKHTYKLF